MTSLVFRDDAEFHRAAFHMAVAGAMAGLGAHVAQLAWPALSALGEALPMAALLSAAAYGAARPETRLRLSELGILGFLGLVAALALSHGGLLGAGVFALAFGAAASRGLSGPRWLFALLAGGAAALLAGFASQRLALALGAPRLELPAFAVAGFSGAAFATVAVLGLVPRHLELKRDRLGGAFDNCRERFPGEIGELLERARAVWEKVDGSLERGSMAHRAIEGSLLRLLEMASRWKAVEADGSLRSVEPLVLRLEEMDQKIARAEDPIVRSQYERAREALAEQLRYLREISTSRERVIARMHHYLTAMERLRLAVLHHRSADASRLSAEIQPIVRDLDALGRDLDATSAASGELEAEEQA